MKASSQFPDAGDVHESFASEDEAMLGLKAPLRTRYAYSAYSICISLCLAFFVGLVLGLLNRCRLYSPSYNLCVRLTTHSSEC